MRNGLHWRDERYIQVIRTGQNILELSLPCLNKSAALIGLFPEWPQVQSQLEDCQELEADY